MQYFQKHAFWDITRQNRSSGSTPSCADEQTKKAQTNNISPLRGGHAPEPIDMPYGILSGIPDVMTHAKFYVNRLRGFSVAAPPKVPFPILFRTTLKQFCTTVQTVTLYHGLFTCCFAYDVCVWRIKFSWFDWLNSGRRQWCARSRHYLPNASAALDRL